jgi:hypothetical protein
LRVKTSSYFLIFLLIVMASVIGISLTYPFQSAFVPLIIGSLGFILGVIELSKEVTKKDKSDIVSKEEPQGKHFRIGGYGSVFGWLVGYPVFVYLIGFLIATPIALLCYLKLRGRSWPIAIAVAAIATILIFSIFELGLHLSLWKGLILE